MSTNDEPSMFEQEAIDLFHTLDRLLAKSEPDVRIEAIRVALENMYWRGISDGQPVD